MLVVIRFHSKMHGPYNIRKSVTACNMVKNFAFIINSEFIGHIINRKLSTNTLHHTYINQKSLKLYTLWIGTINLSVLHNPQNGSGVPSSFVFSGC
jgi:hypothetical protein